MSISNEWVDPDEAPPLPPAWFAKADLKIAGVPADRGPRSRVADQEEVALQIDSEVLERFRAQGPGWQGRINAALRNAVGI